MAWYWWVLIGLAATWLLISLIARIHVKIQEKVMLEMFHKEFGPQPTDGEEKEED